MRLAQRKKGVMEPKVRVVMEVYKKAETSVKVGIHQGSVLSPLLLGIVIDAFTYDVVNNVGIFVF